MSRNCIDCGADISGRHHNAVRCAACQKEYRKELSRRRFQRWYKLHPYYYLSKLGTGDLGPHRSSDFDEEAALIKNELRRLGLIK